jgi:hypothetical protein
VSRRSGRAAQSSPSTLGNCIGQSQSRYIDLKRDGKVGKGFATEEISQTVFYTFLFKPLIAGLPLLFPAITLLVNNGLWQRFSSASPRSRLFSGQLKIHDDLIKAQQGLNLYKVVKRTE